ncbi:ComEC/Rec2 family competence protein [Stappia sp. F7233]|uniref:ComEC/Rec2 family competence protein n=1 Tax=Stappia albiluteola TaxID=2758565 RepID=A0A839ACD3_9HYPH|nr:ComEC/Rec2 family competence protein [Stappia albiluteola]MBA5776537.1 ComEC/Rec2 family competence protein [Stappia albiluteola]
MRAATGQAEGLSEKEGLGERRFPGRWWLPEPKGSEPPAHGTRQSRLDRLAAYFHALPRAFQADIDRGRLIVWASLAYCCGIALYFRLDFEPSLPAISVAVLALAPVSYMTHRGGRSATMSLLALSLASGLFAATLRTEHVAAPMIERPRSVTVTGFVESVQPTKSGQRLQILVSRIEGLRQENLPDRVRISIRGTESVPKVAEAVSLRARVAPPPGPVIPGGYDYAFRMYFEGVGATGYAFGRPQPASIGVAPLRLRLMGALERFRHGIAERIRARLGDGPAGALAVALLIGDRSGLDEQTVDALREAGLAHVLAISGLHMALFAGAVFAGLRAALALFPPLALKYPIDKWAAGAALAAATFYLVISGASIATQRAYVMIALVLVGRLLGRRALTFRSVALAALAILILTPEALVEPGFQMSFAAVIVLIAAYEEVTRRRAGREEPVGMPPGLALRFLKAIFGGFAALALTSIVAGTATGLIGAYHFQRVAPLGFLVNVLAMPLVTLVVMPFGVLSIALMPLGLEGPALAVMGEGLDLMVAISQKAGDFTPGDGLVGAQSAAGVLAAVVAGLALCLFPVGYRRLSVIPFLAAAVLMAAFRSPDLYIAADGSSLAFRDGAGELKVAASRLNFEASTWLRADAVPERQQIDRRLGREDWNCDRLGCVGRAHGEVGAAAAMPITVALVRRPAALEEDCRRADMVVTHFDAPRPCGRLAVFDRSVLNETGAVSLKLRQTPDGTLAIAARAVARSPDRPWGRIQPQ